MYVVKTNAYRILKGSMKENHLLKHKDGKIILPHILQMAWTGFMCLSTQTS